MARERYLLNAGDETINKNEIVLETGKEKRQNYWYYHKWYYLIGAAALILVILFLRSTVFKAKPDYTIALLTQEAYPEEFTNQLADYMEQYGEDLNGDGKVMVDVLSYQLYIGTSAEGRDANMVMAGSVKFTGDVMMNTSMIFIADEDSFNNVVAMNESKLDFFANVETYERIAENETDRSLVTIPFADCKGLDDFTVNYPSASVTAEQIREFYFDSLLVSFRAPVDGNSLTESSNEKAVQYQEACRAMFEKLKNGA